MTDTLEAVARAAHDEYVRRVVQQGRVTNPKPWDEIGDYLQHEAKCRMRAAITTLMKRMRESLQQELEHLYVLEAESISLAPNSYGAGNASGRREGMKEAMDALDQFEKETLGHD